MSEPKKKKRKKRVVRTKAERIAEMERKLQEEKAKLAFEGIKTAIKDGNVSDENVKEYRKLLRQLRAIEGAPGVLSDFGKDEESKTADKIRQKLIAKLQNLMDEPGESSEEEEEDLEEEEDDDEGEEDDDEDEDDDEEEDDDEDDDDDDDD